ncbi:MAG: pyruvate formate lyase-activating protein [Clostridia bacterium]|nr:pyruvate formate lyase-activating protein [Clostridia bacterium]
MGLVDGPGIRCVVFLQGCGLRCKYCHNPDTWRMKEGDVIDSEALFNKINRFFPYFESSGGGVTFSGGEPLLQPEFLLDMLKRCREAGIHTAVDTAGAVVGDFREILKYTDLLLLDVKHITPEGYKELTGRKMDWYLDFKKQLIENPTDVWIRAVIVPGINDNTDYIRQVWAEAQTLPRVKKIELLPYHVLGVNKYKELGIPYLLEGVPPMDRRHTQKWQNALNRALLLENKNNK